MMGFGKERVLKPFYGAPRTYPYLSRKRGLGYKVNLRELTPLRAKAADAFGVLTAIALAVGACVYLHRINEQNGWIWAAAIIAAIISQPVLQWLWSVALRKNMAMSLDNTRLKRHWFFTRGVHETRGIGGFALAPHRKAQHEAQRHQEQRISAMRRGGMASPKPFHQDCAYLAMQYHAEYKNLVLIYPEHRAKRAEQRMQAVLIRVLQQGATRSFDPYGGNTDWTNTSGEFD